MHMNRVPFLQIASQLVPLEFMGTVNLSRIRGYWVANSLSIAMDASKDQALMGLYFILKSFEVNIDLVLNLSRFQMYKYIMLLPEIIWL